MGVCLPRGTEGFVRDSLGCPGQDLSVGKCAHVYNPVTGEPDAAHKAQHLTRLQDRSNN